MNLFNIKKVSGFTALAFLHLYVIAQDTTTIAVSNSTNTSITEELWYLQKWVWIVAGAVLSLIIIALVNGGKRKKHPTNKKIIITKTVETETVRSHQE